ncbi:MAG: hypothetical protein Rhirs2KO_26260 [Rhizobiaceae bacterium]
MRTAKLAPLMRPLLERHADLEMRGRWIVVKPVRHVFRGIMLDRTSGAATTAVSSVVWHLFEFQTSIPLIWKQAFPWLDLSRSDQLESLFDGIERIFLPQLRAVQTVEDLVAYVDRHWARHRLFDTPETKVIVDAALGRLGEARAVADANIVRWSSNNRRWDDVDRQQMSCLANLHDCLVSGDIDAIARLLHEWEAATVKHNKLEGLWEPTPFPLEKPATS